MRKGKKAVCFLVTLWASMVVVSINAQQPAEPGGQKAGGLRHAFCPMMQAKAPAQTDDKHRDHHVDHSLEMNRRGDKAMGFSHAKTTHHFRLLADGGAIEVEANDPKDAASRDQIRKHLTHIAQAFASGDFSIPNEVHGQVPPGAPAMKQLKEAIKYGVERTGRGSRVRISTSNADALKAIHEFLRFQIKEHQTGDSLEVGNR